MKRLPPISIRAKLTFTAVAVMGVLFIVLGVVVQVLGRREILGWVDGELSKRADEIIEVHRDMQRHRPPPRDGQRDPNGPDGPDSNRPGQGPRKNDQRQGPRGPNDRPPDRMGGFQRAMQKIGDPLLAIGPRFVSVTPGPPIAPPDMMVPYDSIVIKKAERQRIAYSTIYLGTEKVRIISKLGIDDDGRKWIVQYPYPLGDIDRSIAKLNQTLLILLPFGLLLTAFACLFLMKRIMEPIREITLTADSIRGEDMSGRLAVQGSDEFALLAGTMNRMLDRIDTAFTAQKRAMEQLESILRQQRRFTADASHELKTPLAVIKANTGLILHGMKLDEDTTSSVRAIDQAATRMNKLVQGLMLLAKTDSGKSPGDPVPYDLNLTVQNAIDHVPGVPDKRILFEGPSEPLVVRGQEADMERVFVNLVDNAIRYSGDSTEIRVSVGIESGWAVVTVADSGPGIAEEHIEHVFDRFYRVDESRSSGSGGTGLGLAICKGIVESQKGKITLTSKVGSGTTVTVSLPMNESLG